MSKIFKPRRGKASTMLGTKSSTVLAAGEMFIEVPDTGVGTGVCKMKMGDGVTAYSSLPYAMGGDIASTEITGSIVEDSSTAAKDALANVTTGRTLGAIIGSLRKACQLNANSIEKLNDDLVNTRTHVLLNNTTGSCISGYYQAIRTDGILIGITNNIYQVMIISFVYHRNSPAQAFLCDTTNNAPISFGIVESTTKWLIF